ncbi:MAG TPA: ATP-binding protein [Candidatus Polarisedimenticolaceae bacterium]|nr:ATP-binding protein [Candidatus Polarisedimenticolaceae bacterium]
MTSPAAELRRRYAATLRGFLELRGESGLSGAYELGRQALREQLGVMELSTIHHEAVETLRRSSPALLVPAEAGGALQSFFIEALSPFEIVHRGSRAGDDALRRLNEALEDQARRIAHALHDEAGPLLVTLHLELHLLARDLDAAAQQRVAEVRERLTELETHLRRLSHELRPTILEERGLEPALRFLAESVSIRSGVAVRVDCPEFERLPASVETALYRIVQEALLNVGKHAHATRASVRVARESRGVRCSIRDDGTGFAGRDGAGPTERSGLGLVGIRERLDALGGTLRISSPEGRGTELRVTIPLEA